MEFSNLLEPLLSRFPDLDLRVHHQALYTLLVDFRRAPTEPEEERHATVEPDAVKVEIEGTRRQRALVMNKLGTIPEDEEVELPVFRGED